MSFNRGEANAKVTIQYFDEDGNEVSKEEWLPKSHELIRETVEEQIQEMIETASPMICSSHQQKATLKFIVTTNSEFPLEVEISGCCDDFKTRVQESLSAS